MSFFDEIRQITLEAKRAAEAKELQTITDHFRNIKQGIISVAQRGQNKIYVPSPSGTCPQSSVKYLSELLPGFDISRGQNYNEIVIRW